MQELSPYNNTPPSLTSVEHRDLLSEERGAGNLRLYKIALVKFRWMILAASLAAVSVAVLFLVMKEPVYTAAVTVQIQGQTPNVTGVPEAFAPGSGSGTLSTTYDYYQTQFNILKSKSLVARVIKELDLEHNPSFRPAGTLVSWAIDLLRPGLNSVVSWVKKILGLSQEAKTPPVFEFGVHPQLIKTYLDMLAINPVDKSQLVEVQFSSIDPTLAKTVADAHATAFIRMSLQTRFELTKEARQFLEEKLGELKAKVTKSEAALNAFQKLHQVVSLEKGENLVVDRLMGLNRDLTEAQAKRIDLESLHRVVQQRDNRLLSQVVDNHYVQQLKDQISSLEAAHARMATKFKPTYSGVAALQEQIDQAKNRLNQELNRIVRTIESDYVAAKTREEALTEEMNRQKEAALDLQGKIIEYALLQREVESNRTLYEKVSDRMKETALAGEVPISSIQIVDRAEFPIKPVDSSGALILVLSAVIGLLGGAGLALARFHLDDTLKTPEDVGTYLHLPTLGIVPDIKRLDRSVYGTAPAKITSAPQSMVTKNGQDRRELAIAHHPLSLIAESYRVIRTAILFSSAWKPPKTILITSSEPQEGKTINTINLAISFAQNSSGPVLLIDADLRNGHCHRLLGMENGSGLTNVLTGNQSIRELVKKTAIDNLYLLGRGELSPKPAELLGSGKMQQVLASLGEHFSFIIIDSAPLLPIVDTTLLSTMVDGVVLVVKGQQASYHVVRKAHERLAYVKAKVLGVILNNVDISSPEYGQFKQSYTSYYLNYGHERQGKQGKVNTPQPPG